MLALACGRVSAQTFEVLMTGPAELVTCQESGDFAVTITNNTGNTANFTDLSLVLEFVGIANASSYEVMSVSGSCGICTFNAINNPPQCIINTGLTSLANTADVSFTFKLKVLCDAKPQITDGGSLLTVNPKVILADYISSSNIAALNPWTFNYNTVQQAAPPFSISFAVTFPFFIQPSANSTSLQVNYTDWSAGSGVVTRTITYTNSGPAGGDFTGEFLFTDAMNCTELIFTTVDISIAGTALPTFNVNAAACTLSYVLTGAQAVHTGETITITEHIQFLNYQAVCLLSACVDGGHNTFATEFSWGCYGTLCRSLNQTATITNQPAPEVTLSRILPTATGGLVPNDGVWETPGVGNTWQYRVTNTGSDVAYFYNLGISSRFAESFYYVTDPSNVTFTHSVSGLITPYTTPLADAFATTLYPGCLNGYLSGGDAPISEAHIPNNIHPTIPFVLLPG